MTMVEERRAERVRSLLRARILFNNNNSTIDCLVKNISSGGAKLEVSSTVSIPEAFNLEVPQKGKTFKARLRWRAADAIGVEFVDDDKSEAFSPVARAEALEVENRKLRAKVAALSKRLTDLGQDVSEI